MKVAKYIEPLLSDIEVINECQIRANLVVNGNPKFNIFTQGIHEVLNGENFIMPDNNKGDDYLEIIIRPTDSTERYTVFDGEIHGYNNMFCDEHEDIRSSISLFEFKGSSVFTGIITLGYSIEYEEEKEEYNVDKDDMVKVMNRYEKISWQQVKEEGYDWINIIFKNENGNTIEVDFELA